VEQLSAVPNLHWPEYAMEAALLGLFMLSACVFTVILQFPQSPVREAISPPMLRRALGGVAMGITAIALIYSPWGQRSGAHINPSVTLTFLRLGKIRAVDAAFYFLFQFAGAAIGVLVAAAALGARIADPAVQYAATYPGRAGPAIAGLGEFIITLAQRGLRSAAPRGRNLACLAHHV
jgi:aquaporin Z